MSKELEAFKRIKDITYDRTDLYGIEVFRKDLDIIETTLKKYDEITNKTITLYSRTHGRTQALIDLIGKNYKRVKITNLEDEKKLKALEIIKEKNVQIGILKKCFNFIEGATKEEECEYYNLNYDAYHNSKNLTQEEFDLLKGVFL